MNAHDLYLRVREKEGRLLPDELVSHLPDIPASHPLAAEWRARANSSTRLVRYLTMLGHPLAILELGCGNGWLSHQLACIPMGHVWGIDRTSSELVQAERVFQRPNLGFLSCDISHAPFHQQAFDIIVLASVIQYFADLPGLIHRLWSLVKPGGEIHLIDSPIYQEAEIPDARQRTRMYYASLGFPEMAEYYFHHTMTDLTPFSPRFLYRPGRMRVLLSHQLGHDISPFPWLLISRQS